MGLTNTTASGAGNASIIAGATYVKGDTNGTYWFCPTARLPSVKSGIAGSMINQATRTATTCFMRGFKETIRIQTSSSIPWFHRRIAFCSKDIVFRQYWSTDTPLNTTGVNLQNVSRGYARVWINNNVNNTPNTETNRLGVLMKGSEGLDWDNLATAPLDTRRVDVKYDKTTVIKSGNERGTVITRHYWHPMNKNLVYDDDEIADVTEGFNFSVKDKRGMGDFYIYDIFTVGTGGGAGDLLKIDSGSTLYWHEK